MCLLSLVISLYLEYNHNKNYVHWDFYKNIFMGVFTSSLLVLFPALIGYFIEKKKYHFIALQTSREVIDAALELFKFMDSRNQDNDVKKYIFEVYSARLNDLRQYYTNSAYFFRKNHTDKLIESILEQTLRSNLFISELIKKTADIKTNKMSIEEYTEFFNGFNTEIQREYLPQLEKYKDMIQVKLNRFNEIGLKKYF